MIDASKAPLDAAMPGLRFNGHRGPARWGAGEVIFTEGDLDTCLYVINDGRVRVGLNRDTDRECLVQVLGPGELFGEESVFDPGPRTTCAVAITDATATRIERDELLAMMTTQPEMAQRFMRILSRRIRNTSSSITDTVYASVAARVAKHLLGLAQRFGVQEHGAMRVPMDLTQEQFAHLVGSSRESVNKALCDFAARGWIVIAKKSIVIRESEPLAARMHGARRAQLAAR
ncbi:Crp/Fnr family transcriptional regulator [Mycobacterium kyogaense]|uniref:Crp/Fnr family transcriptional regulator n=1 Tax=Mycobacterium kyogaense TaxID=2212479 RepID=UPI000DABFBF8|nr:Crp/Fnr family transcriptional regulator [Mycobacterium kyogaense]